ncbi:MAG: NAD(P)-dependent oxidoreductase [Luteibaculaceae bacterium]
MHINLGIIREGKTPPDKRVPLTPTHVKALLAQYPGLSIYVQPSSIRCFNDAEYADAGATLQEDVSHCEILMGVKEVPLEMLIPNKTYLFFSHTFKKQPYNKKLLKTILNKKIRLIDYEVLTDTSGKRIIGFGRYAGIVGAYNGLLAYGKKFNLFTLKPANQCFDRKEVENELKKVQFQDKFKLVLTGKGRVGNGALEILAHTPLKRVTPQEFLLHNESTPIYTVLGAKDSFERKDEAPFNVQEFYADPKHYQSSFYKFYAEADMYIPCHYWDNRGPYYFSRADAKRSDFKIKIVADISCDIDGPVASTLRPSTIAEPLYGYDPQTESETDFMNPNAIGVMAVDNLPCELPRDASQDFGNELVKNVLPHLLGNDADNIIERATQTTLEGTLTPKFKYLEEWVNS